MRSSRTFQVPWQQFRRLATLSPYTMLTAWCDVVGTVQAVKDTVVGSPETATEKAQRVAKETADGTYQTAQDTASKAHSHASDIAQDAQDAYNRQHGDSAYQKANLVQNQ